MAVVNRALSGPININADHSDSMGARDSGWLQVYAESAQEAYDNFIQAVRIGEHKDVRLPVMVCQDGFITSHAVENIEILEAEKVKAFLGKYDAGKHLLYEKENVSMGPYDTSAYYMEHKYQQAAAMENAKKVIAEVAAEYEKISGRKYGFIEEYRMDDAEFAVVLIGSSAGTAKDAVDELRSSGIKAGLVKIRVFRPFPAEEIAEALKNVKAVGIMDKCEGFSNNGGPLGAEVKAALYGNSKGIKAVNFVYGLGGRDVKIESIRTVFESLIEMDKTGHVPAHYQYLDLRKQEV
jgi:pyruvate ferredoxin oxidoreductase alpha subunit